MATIDNSEGFKVRSDEPLAEMQAALEIEPVEPETKPDAEPEPESQAGAAGDQGVPAGDGKPVQPAKIDKRTREGKKASIQSEIDELVGTKHHTQREVEAARSELTRLNGELAELSTKRAPAAPKQPPAEKFPTYQEMLATDPELTPEGWLDKRDEWRDERNARRAAQQAEQKSTFEKVQSLDAKETDYKKTHPEYQAKVQWIYDAMNNREPWTRMLKHGAPIGDVLLGSDVGPQLFERLAGNRQELQRLIALHPIECLRETMRIEAELRLVAASSTGPARAPVISQAKAPLKPVSASPVISDDDVDEEAIPLHEFVRRGNSRDSRLRSTR